MFAAVVAARPRTLETRGFKEQVQAETRRAAKVEPLYSE
jgi:hypothetical protein